MFHGDSAVFKQNYEVAISATKIPLKTFSFPLATTILFISLIEDLIYIFRGALKYKGTFQTRNIVLQQVF